MFLVPKEVSIDVIRRHLLARLDLIAHKNKNAFTLVGYFRFLIDVQMAVGNANSAIDEIRGGRIGIAWKLTPGCLSQKRSGNRRLLLLGSLVRWIQSRLSGSARKAESPDQASDKQYGSQAHHYFATRHARVSLAENALLVFLL